MGSVDDPAPILYLLGIISTDNISYYFVRPQR
jgi:hypothetical protein